MVVAFAAGGSGGHLAPAIAIAEALLEAADKKTECKNDLFFIGTGLELEKSMLGRAGFELESIPAKAVHGKGVSGIIKLVISLPRAVLSAISLFRKRQADVVIGFGGYPSFVPIVAAKLLGLPTVIHESNVSVGLANRVLSLVVKKVFATPGANGFLCANKVEYLPNPVGVQFYNCAPYDCPKSGESIRILVVGGSQGAVSLNTAVLELTELFREFDVSVVHQTGKLDYERVLNTYREKGVTTAKVSPFIENMSEAYSCCHLVICRGGAMTVAEVCATGRPAIYVPLPIAGGHQRDNVEQVVRNGGGKMVMQGVDCADELAKELRGLLSKVEALACMAKNSSELAGSSCVRPAKQIANKLVELAQKA